MNFNSAIETIYDYTNYGNRLQNYAMYSLLEEYGSCTNIKMLLGVTNYKEYLFYFLKKKIQICLSVFPGNSRFLKYRRFAKSLKMTKKKNA